MTAHALYPPSAMARILACPPSAALAANLPERTNDKAQEGTRVHSVIEHALRTQTLPPAFPWIGAFNRNMPDRDVVQRVFDYIKQLGPGMLFVEHKVALSENVWGTLDIGHAADTITVFDYKNGGFDVQVKDNKQLLTYAASFLDAYPTVQWFRLVIFQPNSWGADDDNMGFKQHVHSRTEVEAHRQAVAAAVAYTGPVRPGPHCRWCPAIPTCPAMSQDANFMMAAISRDASMLTAHELVRMLRLIRAVSDMKGKLEDSLTERLKAGAVVDGASLRKSTLWAQWNDERHAVMHLYQAFGPRGVKPLTVAQAKKLGPAGEQYAAVASHRPEPELKASY